MTTIEALQQSTVEGNVVKLPPVQLERNIYTAVKNAIEKIGGKWKGGKIQGFVFEQDPTELLKRISEGEVCDLKKEFQFYETPDALADKLVELAKIGDNDTLLEPSAGRGAIVKAIHRQFPIRTVCGYELMELNRTFLQKIEQFDLLGADFLKECSCQFDVIIANPPFTKNQDIEHILHMYKHLYPKGRLVSVASVHWQFATGKREMAFRAWLNTVNAQIIPIDKGTFKESGTMVESCIILIEKP